MIVVNRHGLGWYDMGIATVSHCNGVALGVDEFTVYESERVKCPRCGKWFELVIDIKLREVEAP